MNTRFTFSEFSFTSEASSGGTFWLMTVQKASQKIWYYKILLYLDYVT